MDSITVLAAEFDRRAERIEELSQALANSRRYSDSLEAAIREQENPAEPIVWPGRFDVARCEHHDQHHRIDHFWDNAGCRSDAPGFTAVPQGDDE